MSKASKLIRSPGRFFADALAKRLQPGVQQPVVTNLQSKPVATPKPKVLKRSPSKQAGDSVASASAAAAPANTAAVSTSLAEPVIAASVNDDRKLSNEVRETSSLPEWYNPVPGRALRDAVALGKPLFLYVPWIAEHTNSLVSRIQDKTSYEIAELDFIRDINQTDRRKTVLRFARENPDVYRKLITRRLVELKPYVRAMVFTFDWAPVMRIIATVCEELEIPRILVPHESVFVDRQKYYWDMTALASVPSADVVLAWGDLQKEIFQERGYPAERIITTGAPKFDTYANKASALSRSQFSRLYSLDPDKKIILFATQPLDSQMNVRIARDAQRQAINDIVSVAAEIGAQVIVRMPPSRENILGNRMMRDLLANALVAVDDANFYLVPADEAVKHSDVVASINSTMLFEAVLAGKPALSLKYVEFDQIWSRAGIPAATNPSDVRDHLVVMLNGDWSVPADGMAHAAKQFSSGSFDGQAADRIRTFLREFANGDREVTLRKPPLVRALFGEPIDVMAIPSSELTLEGTQKYLGDMMRTRTIIPTKASDIDPVKLASVDVFAQWGITESKNKAAQAGVARQLSKPLVIIEDGFLRSLDIGLSGEAALSILVDDKTAYYDATKVSRLALNLESGRTLSDGEMARARSAIDAIQHHRLSKYNHAPDLRLNIGTRNKKLLLVDQRFGDQSVASGLGSESSFDRMISDVMRTRRDWDIIVKQHPDALKGGKQSYLIKERFPFRGYADNLHFIDFDVNPHTLFDLVNEVYVVSSGVGMEALMAGKSVHCYGMPFYAGWGATTDKIRLETRTRKRTIEEIFHFAYIEASRYYSPDLGRACEIEDTIKFLADHTQFADENSAPKLRLA